MTTCAKCGSVRRERDFGPCRQSISVGAGEVRTFIVGERCADCQSFEIVPDVNLDEHPTSPVPEGGRCVACGFDAGQQWRAFMFEWAVRDYVRVRRSGQNTDTYEVLFDALVEGPASRPFILSTSYTIPDEAKKE